MDELKDLVGKNDNDGNKISPEQSNTENTSHSNKISPRQTNTENIVSTNSPKQTSNKVLTNCDVQEIHSNNDIEFQHQNYIRNIENKLNQNIND